MTLIVCSKSTEKYINEWDWDDSYLVVKPPTMDLLKLKDTQNDVIAIGGGSVIDAAKIISLTRVRAIPTTFSGASRTSHAVYWDKGKKCDVKTKKPITIVRKEYLKGLSGKQLLFTKIDCLCHIMESLISEKATNLSKKYDFEALEYIRKDDWLKASLLAGDAIEIAGTNIIHGLSYPLTAKYNVSHGHALGIILDEALFYPKIRKELLGNKEVEYDCN